jgi:hypothetical protein
VVAREVRMVYIPSAVVHRFQPSLSAVTTIFSDPSNRLSRQLNASLRYGIRRPAESLTDVYDLSICLVRGARNTGVCALADTMGLRHRMESELSTHGHT